MFLGSLRSDLDDEIHLHESFARLQSAAAAVRAAYLTNRLSALDAANAFQSLRLVARDGTEWTVGPSSTRWYNRRSGGTWSPAPPPSEQEPADGEQPVWLSQSVTVLLEPKTARPAPVKHEQADVPVAVLPQIELPDDGEAVDWLLSEWRETTAAHEAQLETSSQMEASSDVLDVEDQRAPQFEAAVESHLEWVSPEKYWWKSDDSLVEDLAPAVQDARETDQAEALPGTVAPAVFPADVGIREFDADPPKPPLPRSGATDISDTALWEPAQRQGADLRPNVSLELDETTYDELVDRDVAGDESRQNDSEDPEARDPDDPYGAGLD